MNQVKKAMKGRLLSLNEYDGPFRQSEIPKFMRRNGNASVRIDKMDMITCQQLSQPSSSSKPESELSPILQPDDCNNNEVGGDVDIGIISAS